MESDPLLYAVGEKDTVNTTADTLADTQLAVPLAVPPHSSLQSHPSTLPKFHIGWPGPTNSVRVVCVGETYATTEDPSKIPRGDIYLHAGGFCDYYGNRVCEFAEYLQRLPHKYKVVIVGTRDAKYSVDILRATTDAIVLDSPRGATTLVAGVSIHAVTHLTTSVVGALTVNTFRVNPITCSRDIVVSAVPPRGIFDNSYSSPREVRNISCGSSYLSEQLAFHPPRVCVFSGAPSDGGAAFIGDTLYANVGQYYHENGEKIKFGVPIVIDL